MPLIGWFPGMSIEKYIETFDHWIALGLLLFIGGKIIFDAFTNEEESIGKELKFITLIG